MDVVLLSLGAHSFVLSSGTNVARLTRTIRSAVRRGGDFVRIPVVGSTITVLVSPGVPVVFERRSVAPDIAASVPVGRSTFDWDL